VEAAIRSEAMVRVFMACPLVGVGFCPYLEHVWCQLE